MSPDHDLAREMRGPVAYMVRNGVAANLLMCFIVATGFVSLSGLVQEAFPVLSFDQIEISVPYPGATPDEVEESIVVKIEERIGALDAVHEVTSVAAEGMASVMVELRTGADMSRVLADVESAVGRIQTLPAGAERPEIREVTNRQSVIRLVLYGDVSERALKETAYRIEDEIAALSEVSYVETSGVRNYEISIEVPLHRLRALGLTLEDVSNAVRRGSLDLSAGRIETKDRQVRVRTTGQRYDQQDFEEIVVLSQGDGTLVRLGDIAQVRDGFQEADLIVRYQGQPAVFVEVYRTASEPVVDVARAVGEFLDQEALASLPAGIGISIWNNDSDIYEERLSLLLKNGFLGLLLVLLSLALFLEIRVAFWVAVGIAISGIGALSALLLTGISINSISLFAFVLAIGIVVDDAVVVAEQIHLERAKGAAGALAAIRGTRRIQGPLVFAVLTSVAAFSPLLFVPGILGELTRPVPVVLIAMVLVSLTESLLVLPNHLSHLPGSEWNPKNPVERGCRFVQARVDRATRRFVEGPLDRGLRFATGEPLVTLAGAVAILVLSVALIPAGIVGVVAADVVEGDIVTANLEMPEGTPADRTAAVALELEAAGRRVIERLSRERPEGAIPLLSGVTTAIGVPPRGAFGGADIAPNLPPPANIAKVEFKLIAAQRRDLSAGTVLQEWRGEVGNLPEARSLTFTAEVLNLGSPVHVELAHPDPGRLGPLAEVVTAKLGELEGVFDIRSDHTPGLQEVRIELRPEARTLGLTLDGLARQVRSAFFGDEALRVQRGREDVRVYVRLPAGERDAIADVEGYLIRTPAGAEVPLRQVASLGLADSPSSIHRKDGQRVVTVTADVDPVVTTGGEATAVLASTVLPDLVDQNPGLSYSLGGQQQQQIESFGALGRGFVVAALAIYALLAIPLGSYTKPLIVMTAIPFGIIGAILGHLILGISMSLTSMMGILGISGVVVNDSLMMIDFINERRREGAPARTAIIEGAKGRFRPIFLTSLTTFLGFAPLIFDTAVQARFLVPFAASMGFGIVFATAILMMVVPALSSLQLRGAAADPRAAAA